MANYVFPDLIATRTMIDVAIIPIRQYLSF